jgi:hypothetical protein
VLENYQTVSRRVILGTSPKRRSEKFAVRNSYLAYNLACLARENGHVTYRLEASKLLQSFS